MKKFFTLLLSLLPFFAMGQNQLANPGFEDATWDTGWFGNSATIEKVTDPANVHSGTNACLVTTNLDLNKKGIRTNNISGLDAGAYIGGAWIKATAGLEFKVQIVVGGSNYLTNNFVDVATGDWQHISIPFAISEGDTYKFVIQAWQLNQTFYVDDCEITPVTGFMNGNIENGVDVYWSEAQIKNAAVATISNEATDVNGGSNAMKVQITTPGTSNTWGDVVTNSSSLIAFNGAPKVISFFAKAETDTPGEEAIGGFGFGYKNAIGKAQSGDSNYNGSFNLTSNYRQYKWAIGSIDYTTYFYAGPSLRCGPSAGSYYVDDITIEEYPGTPTITSTAIETADVGTPYSYTLTSSNPGIGKWGLSKDVEADWLTIDKYTGELSGTPDANGTIVVTATLNDGINTINQVFSLVVSEATAINETEITSFNIYPNPASSIIKIQSDNKVEQVAIYTVAGLKVLETSNTSQVIDIAQLPNGLYIVSAIINGETVNQKFTKK
ncbi:T9SS type A sorting domain-containing protein [Labilibacter sediminis]|nr:T9SS type A sorting domain-containing protein [Labilibacter sediminis]